MSQTTPVLQPGEVNFSGFILGTAKHGPPSGKIGASQVDLPAEPLGSFGEICPPL